MLATPPKLSVEIIAEKSLHIGKNVTRSEKPVQGSIAETELTPSAEK